MTLNHPLGNKSTHLHLADADRESIAELKAEVAKLRQQLTVQEKLASMGVLTAGVSHELKSPLNFINNFAELCAEMLEELNECINEDAANFSSENQETVRELMETLQKNTGLIINHGNRAKRIVGSLMQLSREDDHKELQPTDFNQLVDEFSKIAYHGAKSPRVGAPVTLSFHADPELGEVDLLPHSLSRVVLNLVSNAMDALMSMEAHPEKPRVLVSTAKEPGYAAMRIRDNGPGIDLKLQQKIFEPFFTTKPSNEGHIGLGLALCREIVVDDHAGKFLINSQPGVFTEFTVLIPLKEA
jgi:signal transduction histidine kinase